MSQWAEFQGRIEDDRLVTGRGAYVADVRLDGMTYAFVVRAPVAHARIRNIQTAAATAVPGVLAVLTAADLDAEGVGSFPCSLAVKRPDGKPVFPARRPVLASDRIRAVGEPVAFVVAETFDVAEAAAELVEIDYEELPAIATTSDAGADGAPLVWDEVPDNVAFLWQRGDTDAVAAALASAHKVVRLDSDISRVNALSLEPRGAVGAIDDDGRLVLYASNQSPYVLRSAVAGILNVAPARLRVVAGDVGGSFGMKSGAYPEDILVLVAARRLGRPVRWISERRESFLADDHGREMHVDAELGVDRDGRFVALRVGYRVNIGSYLSGRSTFMLNNIGGVAGVYRIPAIAAEVAGIHTNTMTNAPYRGAGRPEATYTIERLIDLAARELGLDVFEIRRRNLVPPSAMPYDTGFVFTYDCGEFEANMLEAARLADRAGFPARREEARRRGKLLGLGIANPIEVAGGPYTKPGKDHTRLVVHGDGGATLFAGVMSTGQGVETVFTDLVASRLGIPRDRIVYRFGDTDLLPNGRGNGGSSSIAVGGTATVAAIGKVVETGKRLAAELLEATPDQIDFVDGRFPVRGTNRSVGLAEVARLAESRDPAGLGESAEFEPPKVTYPNGCHFCEVEVDPETGVVEIVRYTISEDIGTVLNPMLAQGQIQGGVAMGVGQALGERIVYDPDSAQLLTGSFMDYQMPRAEDVPDVRLVTRPVPTKVNALGAKGVGEAGTVGSLVATINAICDALAPLGVRHLEMPATPPRVWAAIQQAQGDAAA